jgi:hypothetical protein
MARRSRTQSREQRAALRSGSSGCAQGNVAELEHGRFRSETPIEFGAGGISGLEIRF